MPKPLNFLHLTTFYPPFVSEETRCTSIFFLRMRLEMLGRDDTMAKQQFPV